MIVRKKMKGVSELVVIIARAENDPEAQICSKIINNLEQIRT
ncbi:MAG: hypothetical protein QW764_05180 [Desulfurococcaceae archaeon]